jgi:hypothetical protein
VINENGMAMRCWGGIVIPAAMMVYGDADKSKGNLMTVDNPQKIPSPTHIS